MKKNNYFTLTTAQQRTILEQTAIKKALPKQAIEKDLWVTTILQIVFSLPCADSLVFKGGTSLSKVWGLINRFSEDIDLAIDRSLFELEGDLTKKQVKKLRKASSVFVRDELYDQLVNAISETPLNEICQIEAQPDGEGDAKYPEPRSIFVSYESVFNDQLSYLPPTVKIEAGARSLLEPSEEASLSSMVEQAFPTINTTIVDSIVNTTVAEKTFLEKAFLLHELFSVRKDVDAQRKSRHMYDLHMMLKKEIDKIALPNHDLWETIRHHRSMLTSMQGVDYTADIRKNIQLIPPSESLLNWKKDYEEMSSAMIYGEKPVFAELLESMNWLELLFKKV
jgi:predicted nucleotidyltransferase component of viral defense system